MKKQRISLGGQSFEVSKMDSKLARGIQGCDHNEIYSVYARPSSTKVAIWEQWCKWCNYMNDSGLFECGIHIQGHNSNFFSIGGYVVDVTDGTVYALYITHAHNRIIEGI